MFITKVGSPPMDEAIYQTFLERTIRIGEEERKIIQKYNSSEVSPLTYLRLSATEKGKRANCHAVLLSKATGLTSLEVKKVVADVFRYCPQIFVNSKYHVSEFILLSDIRFLVTVMDYLEKNELYNNWDRLSCIQIMHRSPTLYKYLPSVMKQDHDLILQTLDCLQSPLLIPEYCNVLQSQSTNIDFAINCLQVNVAAYEHFKPEIVDNFDILVELIYQGCSRKSCLITKASIFLDIVAYLKFTLEHSYHRNPDDILKAFQKQVKEKLKTNECIYLSCHGVRERLQNAKSVSRENISAICTIIQQELGILLDGRVESGYQNKLLICWKTITKCN